ncbi:MAG: LPS biosynthesis protein [Candidatus Woesearchaeota archaeon]|nr:MAG: LPS biosynthesis protein [Candidatus Woesearchaeota archaeon]
MKIAEIARGYNPEKGGIGKHIYLFTEKLKKRHNINIYSNINYDDRTIKVKEIFTIPISLLFQLLKSDKEIYHVHGYQTFYPLITVIAAKIKKRKIIFTPHFHPFGKKPLFLRRIFDNIVGKYVFKNVDLVIAITAYEKELLIKQFKIKNKKIIIIPNALDPIYIKTKKNIDKEKTFKIKNNIKKGYNILYVGRYSKHKNLERLIHIFDNLNKKIKKINLLIIGSGNKKEEKYLLDLISNTKNNNIKLIGNVNKEDLITAYDISDIFVLPSSYEAFGIVLIEAMSRKCAVIASNVGGIPHILGYGKYGLLINTTEDISKNIKRLLKNKTLMNYYKNKSLKRALEFNIDNCSEKLEKILNETLI